MAGPTRRKGVHVAAPAADVSYTAPIGTAFPPRMMMMMMMVVVVVVVVAVKENPHRMACYPGHAVFMSS